MLRLFARLLLGTALPFALNAAPQEFTVADSIGMNTVDRGYFAASDYDFSDTIRSALSPDGSRFFLVTSRGDIEEGVYVTSLWIYDTDDVLQRVRAEQPLVAAGRKVLERASRTSRFALRKVGWLDEGRQLTLIADQHATAAPAAPQETGVLYVLDAVSGDLDALTRAAPPVVQYASGGDRIVYSTETTLEPYRAAEQRRRAGGFVLTDESLDEALDPHYLDADFNRPFATWSLHLTSRVATRIVEPPYFLNQFTLDQSVSADGRFAIVRRPISGTVPERWREYAVPAALSRILSFGRGGDGASAERYSNVIRQFRLLDLATGISRPLLEAPTGELVNTRYIGAVWPHSPASAPRFVIVAGTYLPLGEAGLTPAMRAERTTIPYVAQIDLQTCATQALRPMKRCAPSTVCESVSGVVWDAASSSLKIFGSTDSGQALTWLYKQSGSKWRLRKTLQEGRTTLAGSLRLFIREDPRTPPDVWVQERATGREAQLTDLNARWRELNLGRVEDLQWQDASGQAWTAGLLWPTQYTAGRRYPLVIQTHGYDAQRFLVDGPAPTGFAARALAGRQMFVAQLPDLNLGSKMLSPEEAPAHVRGYESLVSLLAKRELIEPQRVGLLGWSRTCYHVKYALTHSQLPFAAATAADGVDFSYLNLLWAYPTWHEVIGTVYGGLPVAENLKNWIASTPAFNVANVRAPLRIETMTKYALHRDWEMYAMLRMADKPTELVYFPEGSHLLVQPAQRLTSQQGNVDWFDFWLNDHEDPDSAKEIQYARWRKLREQHRAAAQSTR